MSNKIMIKDYISEELLDRYLKEDKIKEAMNYNPPEKWIQKHPQIKNFRYLPIGVVEHLLDKIYKKWKIEVKETGLLLNSIKVTVRVWYRDLQSGEMEFQDGVGACEIQTKKGTGALKPDTSNINTGSVEKALGTAKSVAIKDACDHLGSIFGRNLNRKDVPEYESDKSYKEQILELGLDKEFGDTEWAELKEKYGIDLDNATKKDLDKVKEIVNGVSK